MRPMKPDFELMETTEIIKLRISPSFRRRFDSSNVSRENSSHELPRYTSLKDIIFSTSPQHPSAGGVESGFDSSNISIRNELVKHAASVYVQSAAINPTNRDEEDWVSGFWEKMTRSSNCVRSFHSCCCCEIHVRELVEIFYGIVDRIRNAVRGRSSVGDHDQSNW